MKLGDLINALQYIWFEGIDRDVVVVVDGNVYHDIEIKHSTEDVVPVRIEVHNKS